MESLLQDLRYSARLLWGKPGLTLLIIGLLALAIGANTALFSFADAVLFRPLPFAEPDRVVQIEKASKLIDTGFGDAQKFMQWKTPVESFQSVTAYDAGRANL